MPIGDIIGSVLFGPGKWAAHKRRKEYERQKQDLLDMIAGAGGLQGTVSTPTTVTIPARTIPIRTGKIGLETPPLRIPERTRTVHRDIPLTESPRYQNKVLGLLASEDKLAEYLIKPTEQEYKSFGYGQMIDQYGNVVKVPTKPEKPEKPSTAGATVANQWRDDFRSTLKSFFGTLTAMGYVIEPLKMAQYQRALAAGNALREKGLDPETAAVQAYTDSIGIPHEALPSTPSHGRKLSESKALEYLEKAGGNKDKAREMARKDGFTF